MLKYVYRVLYKGADFMMHEQNLSSKIEEIYSILDEIQLNQVEMLLSIQKSKYNH